MDPTALARSSPFATVVTRFDPAGIVDPQALPLAAFAGWEQACTATAVYPGAGTGQATYPLVGLIEEAGEIARIHLDYLLELGPVPEEQTVVVNLLAAAAELGQLCGIVKKVWRNDGGTWTRDRRLEFIDRFHAALAALKAVPCWGPALTTITFPVLDRTAPGYAAYRDAALGEAGDIGWYWPIFVAEHQATVADVIRGVLGKLAARWSVGTLTSWAADRPLEGGA